MNELKTGRLYYPQPVPVVKPASAKQTKAATSFDSILAQKLKQKPLAFSGHAIQRLEKRGISLGNEEMSKLADAVGKAEAKGAKESLVLMGDVAYIVNVANRKVITAVDKASMNENVFTNIDSAVII